MTIHTQNMLLTIDTLKIHYETSGKGYPVVLIHGWGAQLQSLAPIQRHLEKNFQVFSIDLPGFGKSDSPQTVWKTENYSNLIKHFIREVGIIRPIIIGHSFGGKIAIQLATFEPIHKLVLINSACFVKPRKKWRHYLKVLPRKIAKKMLECITPKTFSKKIIEHLKKRIGSEDYRNASGIMREILIQTVNEDLRNCLPIIDTNTLLIWGKNDQETPVSTSKLMEKLIPYAQLVILENAGHFSYLDQFQQFIVHLNQFLQEDIDFEHI